MNRITRHSAVIVFLCLLLAACGSATPAVSPTAIPAPDNTPLVAATGVSSDGAPQITIGASLPLTGRLSESGTATKRGYEVWATFVNANGGLLGRPVALRILDNASDQATAVAHYEQLIAADKVDLVIGPFSSFLVIPTSEVAARYGYAFVEPAGSSPEVFNRGLTNIFFAQPAISQHQADSFIEYVLGMPEAQRPHTFGIVGQDDPFTLSVVTQVKEKLIEGGIKLMIDEVYDPETTDFSAIASEVAKIDPDLIVGGTQLQDAVGQIQAYRQAGYQPRAAFFTNGPAIPDSFRAALGGATEGVFSSITWLAEADTHQNQEFITTYTKLFGGTAADIAEDAANAFTVGQVLQQAVTHIQSIDNSALIKELHSGTYDTVVGSLRFDESGRPQGYVMTLQWQNNQLTIVAPVDSAQAEPVWPKPDW